MAAKKYYHDIDLQGNALTNASIAELTTEISDRTAGDATNATAVTSEASTRAAADTALAAPQYVTLATSATLANERVLTAGTGITLTDGGAGSTITVAATGGVAPAAHASTHASGGSDPVTLAESQITNLTTDLAAKAPLASPALTGTPTAPTAAGGTNTTQLATTAFVTTAVGAGATPTAHASTHISTGSDPIATAVASGASGLLSGTDKAKLDGIASGATANTGTVTSVAASVPSALLSISGSPITTAGTLALALLTQAANSVLAGPTTGADATPTMRALVAADIPAIAESGVTNLTTDLAGKAALSHTHAAADVTSGVLAIARLATGSPDGTKFIRDDGALAVPSGTGMTSPMTTAGDMIYGSTAGADQAAGIAATWGTNFQWTGAGASVTDGSDTTFLQLSCTLSGNIANDWVQIDLGADKTITQYRVVQGSGVASDPYKIQSAPAATPSTFTDQVSIAAGTTDTGITAFGSSVTARYFRLQLTATTNNLWSLYTVELRLSGTQGLPTRLPIGTASQYLKGGTIPTYGAIVTGDLPSVITTTGEHTASDFKPSGLTGATSASRYVGGTASAAPASGTFAVGDIAIAQNGVIWECLTAGSPGTWRAIGATRPLVVKTGNYTLTAADDIVVSNGSTLTMTLPTAASLAGRAFTIKNGASGTTTTIATTSSQTIDGAASVSMAAAYAITRVVSDGTNWLTI